jgi:hypothetical protein
MRLIVWKGGGGDKPQFRLGQQQISLKSVQCEQSCSCWQTDTTQLIFAFRYSYFANASKNGCGKFLRNVGPYLPVTRRHALNNTGFRQGTCDQFHCLKSPFFIYKAIPGEPRWIRNHGTACLWSPVARSSHWASQQLSLLTILTSGMNHSEIRNFTWYFVYVRTLISHLNERTYNVDIW